MSALAIVVVSIVGGFYLLLLLAELSIIATNLASIAQALWHREATAEDVELARERLAADKALLREAQRP